VCFLGQLKPSLSEKIKRNSPEFFVGLFAVTMVLIECRDDVNLCDVRVSKIP